MGNNVFLTSEGARQFSNALDLLNASIEEFNKVADKMVPERLLSDGLINYLVEFCKSLENDTRIRFRFLFSENQIDLDEAVVTSVFRSIRTLIFMFIRNSHPTTINLDVNKIDNVIQAVIKDDSSFAIFSDPAYSVQADLKNVAGTLQPYNAVIKTRTLDPKGNELVFSIVIQ